MAALQDTVARSASACRAAEEIVRYAREAIATAGERVRSSQETQQAIRITYGRRTRLLAEMNGGGVLTSSADDGDGPDRTGG